MEENIGRGKEHCDTELDKDFLDTTPKEQSFKEQIDNLDLIKILNSCLWMTDKRMKRQARLGNNSCKVLIWNNTCVQNI